MGKSTNLKLGRVVRLKELENIYWYVKHMTGHRYIRHTALPKSQTSGLVHLVEELDLPVMNIYTLK